jgi:hypothetical protein
VTVVVVMVVVVVLPSPRGRAVRHGSRVSEFFQITIWIERRIYAEKIGVLGH